MKTDIFEVVRLRGVHHTAESSSEVCIIPRSQGTQISQKTLRCASHRGVKLRGVHHTTYSSFAVCITPQSQTARHGVKIEIFASLWVLLQGQSGEILLGVNTSIMKEKIWRTKIPLAKPKILTLRCDAQCTPGSRIFRTLWSNISAKLKPNSKIL